MTTYRNRTPGRCIYCPATEQLGKEHIVPEALGGKAILPGASCRACEAITSGIERYMAREFYGQLRVRENLKGKKKKGRPPSSDVALLAGERGSEVQLSVAEPGALAMFPIVRPPQAGIFHEPPARNTGWVGAELSQKTQGPSKPELWGGLPAGRLTFYGPPFRLLTFGRFVAKVAHAHASAVFGLDRFEPWLTPVIRGDDPDFGYLLGASPAEPCSTNVVSVLNWQAFQHRGDYLLAVDIGLFPSMGQPWIRAIVGRTTPDLAMEVLREQRAR